MTLVTILSECGVLKISSESSGAPTAQGTGKRAATLDPPATRSTSPQNQVDSPKHPHTRATTARPESRTSQEVAQGTWKTPAAVGLDHPQTAIKVKSLTPIDDMSR